MFSSATAVYTASAAIAPVRMTQNSAQAHKKRPQPAVGFAQKDVGAAGMRKHGRQLGHRQRATQIDQPAQHPQARISPT